MPAIPEASRNRSADGQNRTVDLVEEALDLFFAEGGTANGEDDETGASTAD